MWKELEAILDGRGGEQLKAELLTDIDFILENYGQPKDYYNSSNPKIAAINEKIQSIRNTYNIIFAEDKEGIVKKLYSACTNETENKDGKNYKEFYVKLMESLNLWLYGDKVYFGDKGSFGEFQALKNRLIGAKRILETGNLPDLELKYNEYASGIGKQPDVQYR